MNKDRFKFRVWDETRKKYWGKEEWDEKTKRYYDDNYVYLGTDGRLREYHFGDVCLFDKPGQIVEQCTGLSDKNEKLIYEGDIIKDKLGRKYQARWNKAQWLFTGNTVDFYPHILNILYTPTETCEIIGNIHEHKENQ